MLLIIESIMFFFFFLCLRVLACGECFVLLVVESEVVVCDPSLPYLPPLCGATYCIHMCAGPMMNKHSVPIHVPGDADFHPGIGAQAKVGDAMGGAIKNALRSSGVPPLYDGLGVTSISDEGEWQDHVQLIHQMALGRDVWPKFHMLWQKALFEGEEGEGGEGEEEEWVDEEEEGKDEEGGAGGEQPEKCNAAREACDGEDEEEEEDEQEEMR